MMINNQTLTHLQKHLDADDLSHVLMLAARVDSLEAKWRRKLEIMFDKVGKRTAEILTEKGTITGKDIEEFDGFFVEHMFAVMFDAMDSTKRLPSLPEKRRLARYPKGPMPRSLAALQILWDQWRKKKKVPPRQKAIVARVKTAYIKKCQDTWRKYSEDFRKGNDADKAAIVDDVKRAAHTEYARSKTIVETETTRYWNQVRREVYDESPDVTHYLFVPVRDQATTEWCNSRRGLVYAKEDPILQKETPPIHWNCRSEILPLTPHNPKHKALIEDKSRWRRNKSCEPLPAGWNQ